MMIEDTALAIACLVSLGAFTGFLSGVLGIGGGIVVVPALIVALPLLGVDGPEIPKIAVGSSLAIVVPTALASAQGHAAKNGIDWYFLLLLVPSFVAGAFVAAAYVGGFNAHLIVLVFILFTLYTAFRLWCGWRRQEPQPSQPRLVALTVRGVVGGALSAFLGIGAAMVAVPYLERFIGLPRAIGTAAALALPMALAGTAAYVAAPQGCASCLGYVYLPAVAAIGIGAVLAAPLGVWAAHAVPVGVLKKTFALFLVLAAGSLAYKTFTPEILAAEAARFAALAKRFMAPHTVALRPAEAPLWIGQEPARAPYFALAERCGPQRAFLPLVVERDEVGPLPISALFAQPSRDTANGFDPVEMQAAAARVVAMGPKQPKAPAVTMAVIAGEQKTREPVRRKPMATHAPVSTVADWRR